ncbi:hypothetical protein Tsubulata_025107 [Turnera subulata]|uniref:Disease resistance protein Roq1-like winged-helix domain-containing protein n=1 Tax=Turnera subulata TaxID=218843 RepID=A0A9Q0JLM1_9ROSI|nr:hypothetical protein Tsubulata_025107 [Turnera subulata]
MNLTKKVLHYADAIPIALKILGRDLYKKDEAIWESTLRRLERFPNKDIQNVLKLSYDGLEWHEQQIFLAIAFVFKGWFLHEFESILDACELFPKEGIRNLQDKCLITISWDKKMGMHDLIQQMAKDIVMKENINVPRRRSRLWHYKDILSVLTNPKG